MDERGYKTEQSLAGANVEPANCSEIVHTQSTVRHDQQISRVRVSMKGAKNEELSQIEIDESLGERIVRIERSALIQWRAHAALLRNDQCRRQFVDYIGNVDRLGISKSAGEQANIACFQRQIGFSAQIVRKLLRERRRPMTS